MVGEEEEEVGRRRGGGGGVGGREGEGGGEREEIIFIFLACFLVWPYTFPAMQRVFHKETLSFIANKVIVFWIDIFSVARCEHSVQNCFLSVHSFNEYHLSIP